MKKIIKKTISVLILSAFFLNVVLPPRAAQAMTAPWWSGSQVVNSTNVTSDPSREGGNDNMRNQQGDGEPVLVHNGDFVYQHRDLLIPSRGIDTEIVRIYKSQSRYDNRFGYGWDITYNKRIIPLCNGDLYYLNGELNRYRFIYVDGINYISPDKIYDKVTQNPDGTYTLKEKHGSTHEFDQNGILTDTRDRNGNGLHFTYDPGGRLFIMGISIFSDDPDPKVIAFDYKLIRITDTAGREINLNYNDSGRLESMVDSSGRTYTYAYDPSGNGDLISVTTPATAQYPSGTTTTYAYEAHKLVSITDAKGQTYLVNHYDADGRVDSQNYGNGTFTFSYDPPNRRTTVTNPKGFITQWTYNDNGNILSKKEITAGLRPADPDFYTTNSAYNAFLERTQVTYPKGNGIKYTFDEGNPDFQKVGNLLEIRRKADMAQADNDTNDIVTRFTYEEQFNFIKTMTDPLGRVTTYTYDYELDPGDPRYGTHGNLVKIAFPPVSAQTPEVNLSYNSYGQPVEVIDPNDNVTRYEYFPNTGYLQKIIQDPGGIDAVSEFTYDAFGNIASVKDPDLRTTGFVYNELNRLIRQTDPLGYLTKYSYDANGNLTKAERQANAQATQWQTTEYTYTALDKLATSKDPLNRLTTFTYDLNDNRHTVLDAQGNTTTYDYDERDLLWKVTDANTPAGVTEYAYDLNGQLAKIKDAKAQETGYLYDNFDRLQKMTFADTSFHQYAYDKNSNLVQDLTPSNAAINYEYDALNRLTAKRFPASAELDVTYGYDLGSRLTSVLSSLSSIGYTYDALNRITEEASTLNAIRYPLAYEYDGAGNRTKVTYPHGAFFNYSYDALSRLSEVKDFANQRVALFNYDALSRRTQLTYANNTKTDYQYDMANQLRQMSNYKVQNSQTSDIRHQTSDFGLGSVVWGLWSVPKAEAIEDVAVPPGTFSYSAYHYDRAGNRVDLRSNNQLTRYNYNNIYELTGVSGPQSHAYNYDNVGNRTNADNLAYQSNNLNQYTQVGANTYSYDGNGNLTSDGTSTYTYDAENRLLSALSPQHSASYDYDGLGRRISKTVDGSTTYFIYDGDRIIEERDSNNALLASYVYGEGIDEILTMHRGPQKVYYHYDGLGSVTNLTDPNGEVIESYTYDVYGQLSQLSTIGNRYYFTGREFDDESGLYHYRARAYSPTIGRFLQRDPVGYWDSMNLFSYVNNSPTNFTDPLGWTPFAFRPPYDPEVDRTLNQNYQNSYNDLANSKTCEKKPIIRPRELDTFTQISTGLGFVSAGPQGVLFGRRGIGILNNNPYFRIGWGWKGTRESGFELFRIAIGRQGSGFHWHFDFWNLLRR